MKARTLGVRILILADGTKLIPTHDFVKITDREASHKFTSLLVKKGEVLMSGAVEQSEQTEQVEQTEQSEQVEQTDTSDLRVKLSALTKDRLVDMLNEVGITESTRTNKDVLIDKLIEYETEI